MTWKINERSHLPPGERCLTDYLENKALFLSSEINGTWCFSVLSKDSELFRDYLADGEGFLIVT